MIVEFYGILTDGKSAVLAGPENAHWDSSMFMSEITGTPCQVPEAVKRDTERTTRRRVEPTPVIRNPIYAPHGRPTRGRCPTKRDLR